LAYEDYYPKYNDNAEKTLSVTVSESNYFNILQSIAEKFECWLDFKIIRDTLGGIQSKEVAFRNYSGKDNYACFRYGVNLKNIKRTYESKNLVTKLYVKPNNNEFANNGFCSIQRAKANLTGENYIYDF
jgi:phage minor structural protein